MSRPGLAEHHVHLEEADWRAGGGEQVPGAAQDDLPTHLIVIINIIIIITNIIIIIIITRCSTG